MVYELVVEFEIIDDRPVRYALKPSPMPGPLAAMILEAVAEELKLQRLLATLGAPRKYGPLELPGGPLGRS